MSDISKALQGRLSGKAHIKEQAERQLDLFSSLADRGAAAPKVVPPRPEPEMVLPPSGSPPDVAADVRAALSESSPAHLGEADQPGAAVRPPLVTGIYRRPVRPPAAAPLPRPPAAAPRPRFSPVRWLRDWFAGVELDRRLVALVVVLIVLVALVAFLSACPRKAPAPETTLDFRDTAAPATAPGPETPPVRPPAAAPAAAAPVLPAAEVAPAGRVDEWKIPGTTATRSGNSIRIVFTDPVFVSADNISVEGWAALKALAARLVGLKSGARVLVTGYTDDVPLSKPTDEFKNNAELAAARARVALEHLAQFARANKGLAFEAIAGDPARAPYPNDSSPNRRLNRTVTVQVDLAP